VASQRGRIALDERHSTIVEQMWDELERELGHIGVRRTPWPHFSYQVGDYETARINHALETVAQTTSPFAVATAGVAAFTGAQPILYVPAFEPRSCRSDKNAMGRHWRRVHAGSRLLQTLELGTSCDSRRKGSRRREPVACRAAVLSATVAVDDRHRQPRLHRCDGTQAGADGSVQATRVMAS
jgi:hypothetical protein